jgi:hypothetical protein
MLPGARHIEAEGRRRILGDSMSFDTEETRSPARKTLPRAAGIEEARMPLSFDARTGLARRQAAVVEALVAGGPAAPGFDETRLRAAAESLARKRSRTAARAWPELARALSNRWGGLFARYANASPLPSSGGPLADGRAFARWLAACGLLPEAGRLQALAVDLEYSTGPEGLVPRKWPALRGSVLAESGWLLAAAWMPWLGACWLGLAPGRRRPDTLFPDGRFQRDGRGASVQFGLGRLFNGFISVRRASRSAP